MKTVSHTYVLIQASLDVSCSIYALSFVACNFFCNLLQYQQIWRLSDQPSVIYPLTNSKHSILHFQCPDSFHRPKKKNEVSRRVEFETYHAQSSCQVLSKKVGDARCKKDRSMFTKMLVIRYRGTVERLKA